MGSISSVFSLLLFLVFITYIFWGMRIIRLNPKSSLNRMFLLLCMALGIWSLGYAAANSAAGWEEALFWRRLAALGWGTVFSITLHFILLLTNQTKYIKRKSNLLFLYIPSIIVVYIFAISNRMAQIQHNLIKTDIGWVNIPANNVYDWVLNLYYIVFTVISVLIIWAWKQTLQDKKATKQANLILFGILISLVLGTFTDVMASSILPTPIPQISPIFILLPTWAMYHWARHYGLTTHDVIEKDEIVVTNHEQRMIFNNLAISFCIGGIVSFMAEYMPLIQEGTGDFKLALLKGGFMISVGCIIAIIQTMKNESVKELLTIVLLLVSIPSVALQFLESSAITVWALPIVIIISSLVFSKRTLLISATIVAIVTQRLIWILKPEDLVYVGQYTYIGRIGMFITACFIGLYINKIYVAKIKENQYQIAFQKMNSDISFDFVTINQENFDEKVDGLLSRIGEFFQVDRAYLFIINYSQDTMAYSNEWCEKGIDGETNFLKEMPMEAFTGWVEQLKKEKVAYIEDIDYMDEEWIKNHEYLVNANIKSVVTVPIMGKGEIQGFIGMDSVGKTKKWSKENIKLLKIMTNLVASGLAQVKANKEIEFMAYYDHLTKLPNRFLFKDRVDQAIEIAKENGKYISIVFIDLDNFKAINDTMGHDSGDFLLKEVGKSFGNQIPQNCTLARFGGDEFMILLDELEAPEDVERITSNIMDVFAESFNISNQAFFITGSAGVAVYPVDGENAEMLIKNADTAMYQAKSLGKNRYTLCTHEMKEKLEKDVALSNDLHRALENNEFVVYYQPQIDLETEKITGVEALIRWIHPERGMISPLEFIPLAEKNNLINGIGEWVLKTASAQNKKWQEMGLGYINVAVNLSAIQFINPKLVDNVERILEETGLDPKYLELEITEGIAVKEVNNALEILNRLKKIGIAIAIDDFGTEYSSLNRLKMLPIDRLKIDMQFIRGIEHSQKDQAITMVIISLAKNLGLNVLAEGVETKAQLEFLKNQKCDYVQGYYYYKPLPAEEIDEILKKI